MKPSRASTPRPAPPPDSVVIMPTLTGSAKAMPDVLSTMASALAANKVLISNLPVFVLKFIAQSAENTRAWKPASSELLPALLGRAIPVQQCVENRKYPRAALTHVKHMGTKNSPS